VHSTRPVQNCKRACFKGCGTFLVSICGFLRGVEVQRALHN
jgi:hypothetical protein